MNVYLEKEKASRTKLLMYGSIVQFGVGDIQLKDDTPDYLAMLRKEDGARIFLRESYLRKLELFAESKNLPELLCQLDADFPEGINQPGLVEQAIDGSVIWYKPSEQCMARLFSTKQFQSYILLTSGDQLQLRENPSLDDLVEARLGKNVKVFSRRTGPSMVLAGKKDNWHFVFTEEGRVGWLFGRYLKPLKSGQGT